MPDRPVMGPTSILPLKWPKLCLRYALCRAIFIQKGKCAVESNNKVCHARAHMPKCISIFGYLTHNTEESFCYRCYNLMIIPNMGCIIYALIYIQFCINASLASKWPSTIIIAVVSCSHQCSSDTWSTQCMASSNDQNKWNGLSAPWTVQD